MTNHWAREVAPELDVIEELAREAQAQLPEAFRPAANAVLLKVADTPPDDLLQDVGEENLYAITGLYDGIPLTEKSVMDQQTSPDTIWLFRLPILEEWASRGDVTLGDLVGHVYIHELAHHFGWTDDDIAAIDPWWQPAML